MDNESFYAIVDPDGIGFCWFNKKPEESGLTYR